MNTQSQTKTLTGLFTAYLPLSPNERLIRDYLGRVGLVWEDRFGVELRHWLNTPVGL